MENVKWYVPVLLGIQLGLIMGLTLALFRAIAAICLALASTNLSGAFVAIIICCSITMGGTIWMMPSIMAFLGKDKKI